MDLFEEPCLAAALPDAVTFEEIDSAPQQQQSRLAFIFHEVPSGESGAREITRQQWEALKPLIQRVYIEENKPFPYLARILREEHRFEPTKRQFSRQVDKWGFRKNISSSERRHILQSLAGGMNEAAPELQSRRLKATKLENWKRRYRKDLSDGSSPSKQEADQQVVLGITRGGSGAEAEVSISEGELSTVGAALAIAEAESRHALQPQERSTVLEFQEELGNPTRPPGLVPDEAIPMEICQGSRSFDWSSVDVPGSPGLSRLFKGLEIEFAAHVPHLSLDETESNGPSCLSAAEIQEVYCGKNNTASEEVSYLVEYFSTSSQKNTAFRRPQYPWRNIEKVYCGYSISPLTEVYVFPPSSPTQRSRKGSLSKILHCADLVTQERELEDRFAKLRAHLPEDHPLLIAVMESLADILVNLESYEKAEPVERKLVDIYRRKSGPSDIKVLDWSTKLASLLEKQGCLAQAQHLNDYVRTEFNRLGQPAHPIAIRAARNDGWIATHSGRHEDSERFRREVLQITLSTYGPRHRRTIEVLSELGIVMSENSKKGGDTLLRTAVQLSLEELDERDVTGCLAMDYLSWALNTISASEEGYSLATKAVEQFAPLFGQNQRYILSVEENRAWCMLKIGKLVESEKLFRDLLLRQIETNQTDRSNTYCGLANVLLTVGRVEEAICLYEKSLQCRVRMYGPTNRAMIETCHRLLECCEAQGRFDDALKVCQHMIDKIWEVGGDPSGTLAELESEYSKIKEKIKQQPKLFADRMMESSEDGLDLNSSEGDDNVGDEDENTDESGSSSSEDDDGMDARIDSVDDEQEPGSENATNLA